jgi:acyl dehydratase
MGKIVMSEAPDEMADAENQPIDAIRRFYRDAAQPGEWFVVTQALIDQFAAATCDNHWLHTDPLRASRESPYGVTIAHGFWTLSMLSHLAQQAVEGAYPPGALFGINYGFDRARFPGPAPVGSRIRLRYELVDIDAREGGRYLVRTKNSVEVEGQDKPALVAEWLFLLVYPDGGS